MEDKIKRAKQLIENAVKTYSKIAVACSFGKDSMVVTHLAREVDPRIKVFSIMTQYKPKETFEYLKRMNRKMKLDVTIYMVADKVPEILQDNSLKVILLPAEEFNKKVSEIKAGTGKEIYQVDPDECCRLLKVEPTKVAVKDLDAWITGLRNTEGVTRENYQEIEKKGNLVKINPILTFTEAEIWRYIRTRGIEPHPWYRQGYRSLGCAPCTHRGGKLERGGRWLGTKKRGGECGIHTRVLK